MYYYMYEFIIYFSQTTLAFLAKHKDMKNKPIVLKKKKNAERMTQSLI